jgi:hypothetical protein
VVQNRTTPRPFKAALTSAHRRSADPLRLCSHCAYESPFHVHSRWTILHDTLDLIDEVSALRTTLEHFVEAFEAKAPVAAARSVIPNVGRKMREEVMLRTLQASILTDAGECNAVLNNGIIQELKIFQGDVMLEGKQEDLAD